MDQTAFTFSWAWYLVVRFLPNLFAAEAIIVFTFQWVTVKTIVDFQKYSSEYRDKTVTRLRAAEALLLMALPILMAILLIKDVQSVPAGHVAGCTSPPPAQVVLADASSLSHTVGTDMPLLPHTKPHLRESGAGREKKRDA